MPSGKHMMTDLWLKLPVLCPGAGSQARHTMRPINRWFQEGLDFSGSTASLRAIS